jgi:phosphoserine phosphatase
MFRMPDGPCCYVDVDDTLIKWSVPTGDEPENELVTVVCRDIKQTFAINKYNLEYLEKLAVRGHLIIVWSAAGAVWAEAVVKAFGIEHLVIATMSKPTYYVDDIRDANQFMGKHVFFDENGVRTGYAPKRDLNEK